MSESFCRLHVVSHARTARRIKHTQQAQFTCAGIFNAMYLSFWQINARTTPDWRAGLTSPHAALAFQNEKHFFVVMKVIGRAAGGNRADKLRYLSAANLVINQHAIPTIGG